MGRDASVVVDASVAVAAGASDDPESVDASRCLAALMADGSPIHEPTLAVVEVVAAIARRTGDAELAREAGVLIAAIPGLVLHPLDADAAWDAAAGAAHLRLRGADTVYATLALRLGATLITLDDELRERSAVVVDAVTPGEWLARRPR